MVSSVSAICGNLTEELDRDLVKCEESVDSSSTSQRMMFIWMVSMIISPEKKNSWHYCPEDNSEGRWHLRMFFVENKVPFEKLASQTMMGQHADFIALCRGDTHFSKCLRYHWIIHQQTKCSKVTGFDHVVSPVMKSINGICSKSKQIRAFSVLLEDLMALWIWWLSRRWVCSVFFCLFLSEIKEFMQSKGEEASLEMS